MSKKLLKVYKMFGQSAEGHGYEVELVCEAGNQEEAFAKHIEKIGWGQYGYTLKEFKELKTEHIEVDFEES